MKIPANLKFSRLLLFFLLITAGSSLPIQAQDALTEITLGSSEISFSDFSKIGSSYTTAIQGAFPASDGNSYSGWTKKNVQYVSGNKKVAQFKASGSLLQSPTIKSQYGFTVKITYSSGYNPQVQIGNEEAVFGPATTTSSSNGTGQEMSASTSSTSTTFTITNKSSSYLLYVSKITITPNTGSSGGSETTKTEPGISFAQESYTATLGQAFVSPVLNNPNELSGITYTSSEQSVATVDNNGTVSPLAAGTTTITASFAGNDTYAAGMAFYTLTVKQATTPTATTFYKPIKSTEELVDGNVCLLILLYNNYVASSSFNTTNNYLNFAPVKLDNGYYSGKVNAANFPYEITITRNEDSYALYTSDNYLTHAKGEVKFGTNSSPQFVWGISFSESGKVQIHDLAETDRNISYDNNYFKNYKSGHLPKLYQKQTTLQLKEAAQGWATFFNKGFAYVMPQGVKGYYVTLDKNKEALSLSLAYDAGAPVPANTPLLLYGVVGTYNPVVVNKNIDPVLGTNYMQGDRDDAGITRAGENVIYYKLTLDENGENIGFYYGAENGAAFRMTSETSAYLALPKDDVQQVRSLILDAEAINRISPILTQQDPTAIYDLSGRRIYSPQRGLYIQGGRVVFLKGDSLH